MSIKEGMKSYLGYLMVVITLDRIEVGVRLLTPF